MRRKAWPRSPTIFAPRWRRTKRPATFFETLNGANRYAILYRIHGAKKPETRIARIGKFVAMLAAGETIHPQKSGR